jgi:ferredoxin-NADP reductase/DMSO/TMAO reductase YedYZ heme-binding membrane subunit
LLCDVFRRRAGANPVNYAIRTTGLLALIFLAASLLVTPLRKVTGLSWLFHLRRRLGLLAFFHALAHFGIFFVFDRVLSLSDTLSEMVKRPYLVVGSVGLAVMVPLAATSTNGMIKRLGPKRWRALHRLAYVAVVAGVVHFYMLVKSDVRVPSAFGAVVFLLLGYRVVAFVMEKGKRSGARPNASAVAAPATGDRWKGELRVERIVSETHDVRTFRLVPPQGGALPFQYLPGQFLTFALLIGGKTVRRSYTISSTPTKPGYCEVTIKREAQGLVSRHMHDVVREGDTLSIAAPSGRFTCTGEGNARVALIAGGVGITPLMSILRYLTDRGFRGPIDLIYSNKTERDIIFGAELAALAQRFGNLRVTHTLTRPEGKDWTGATGRIDAALLQRVIPEWKSTPFFLCGPAAMLESTGELLRQLGVAGSNIRTESFGMKYVAPTVGEAPGAAFTVTFARSNKAGQTGGERPILPLAEELGVPIDSECRAGICGRCKCRLVAGSVAMDTQEALDESDRRNNIVLLCQARALEDVTLEA